MKNTQTHQNKITYQGDPVINSGNTELFTCDILDMDSEVVA